MKSERRNAFLEHLGYLVFDDYFTCPKHIKIRFDNIIMHSQKQTSDQFGMHGMVFKLSTASEIKPDWTLEGFCKIARMEDPDAPYSFFCFPFFRNLPPLQHFLVCLDTAASNFNKSVETAQ